ncbi:MAG: hypothetical protein Q8M94_10350 [Ignavibacteria bacterium]|nr:hypothetical protein [Ignavibacteria bacterium]
MKHWIILFTPETFEAVKRLHTIGVRGNVWKSFSEKMGKGDRFIGYISKKMLFDSFGVIDSEPIYEEKAVFPGDKLFPCRRKVKFEKINLNKPSGNLFSGIAPFNEVPTGPGNYLMVKGGFVEISEKDFNWLLKEISR